MTFYNDNDPAICRWLEELTARDQLPPGTISTQSITDLDHEQLSSFHHVHLFAGIGGWPYALRLAGWPDDLPVWTGSCPCQPFSCAGQQLGTADPRHLWPHMLRLIAKCRPPVVFGEQVAGKAGREWLSGVRSDLEALGYAVGASDLCAASVGAPHIRQRLWWVASNSNDHYQHRWRSSLQMRRQRRQEEASPDLQRARNQWATEPRPLALAYGVPNRLALLNGYGNAIVPQLAAEFIAASMEAINDLSSTPSLL